MYRPTPIMGKGKTKTQKQIWLQKYSKDEYLFNKNANIDDFQEDCLPNFFEYNFLGKDDFDINFFISFFILFLSRFFRTS